MPQFLFDTDHLTLFHHKHSPLMARLAQQPAGAVGICPINVEETLRGRLAILARHQAGPQHIQAYINLTSAIDLFGLFPLVPFDAAGEVQYQQLRAAKLRVGSLDLKIAAIALTNQLTVLTRNRRDFGRVPGLTTEDWST